MGCLVGVRGTTKDVGGGLKAEQACRSRSFNVYKSSRILEEANDGRGPGSRTINVTREAYGGIVACYFESIFNGLSKNGSDIIRL